MQRYTKTFHAVPSKYKSRLFLKCPVLMLTPSHAYKLFQGKGAKAVKRARALGIRVTNDITGSPRFHA